jgi:hypothetical protein
MKVYFSCSTGEYKKHRDWYYKIRDILLKEEHILTRDWLPLTDERIAKGDKELLDIKEIYKLNIEALKNADIVIIEDTVSNFSTGHQITLALQHKKPTLVLWQGQKFRQFKQMFIHGIESDILEVSEYTDGNLHKIIKAFLRKYEKANERNRFHLVLNNVERNYLDWAQFIKNKSRTKVIREALRKEIDGDEEYVEYLRK